MSRFLFCTNLLTFAFLASVASAEEPPVLKTLLNDPEFSLVIDYDGHVPAADTLTVSLEDSYAEVVKTESLVDSTLPTATAILVDTSGSMRGAFADVKEALRTFVDGMDGGDGGGPMDNYGMGGGDGGGGAGRARDVALIEHADVAVAVRPHRAFKHRRRKALGVAPKQPAVKVPHSRAGLRGGVAERCHVIAAANPAVHVELHRGRLRRSCRLLPADAFRAWIDGLERVRDHVLWCEGRHRVPVRHPRSPAPLTTDEE